MPMAADEEAEFLDDELGAEKGCGGQIQQHPDSSDTNSHVIHIRPGFLPVFFRNVDPV